MGVECGTLVEPPPGSGSCNISVPSISSDDIAAPHRPTRRSGMRQRYAARDAARAREFEKQLDEEFHVHLRPFIEDPGNVARKQMEGSPWRLSMPGSAMRKRNWACPECAEECEPEWPKVIDELQAEVQKLKGKVAELRAEVDELKVRDRLSHLDVPSLEDVRRMVQELAAEVGGNRPSRIQFEEMD